MLGKEEARNAPRHDAPPCSLHMHGGGRAWAIEHDFPHPLPPPRAAKYASIHPDPSAPAKVPILDDTDGTALIESMAIAHYFERKYPEPALVPKDPAAAAKVPCRGDVHRVQAGDDGVDFVGHRVGSMRGSGPAARGRTRRERGLSCLSIAGAHPGAATRPRRAPHRMPPPSPLGRCRSTCSSSSATSCPARLHASLQTPRKGWRRPRPDSCRVSRCVETCRGVDGCGGKSGKRTGTGHVHSPAPVPPPTRPAAAPCTEH